MKTTINRKAILTFSVLAGVSMFFSCSEESTRPDGGNPPDQGTMELSDFSSAAGCRTCHPDQFAQWEGSMHAYAFVDPVNTLWMNGLRDAVGAQVLGTFCVQCHSPIGALTGQTPPGFDKENVPALVKEGITCDACHMLQEASGTAFSEAVYHYDVKSGKKYAALPDPAPNTAHGSESKEFYNQSRACLPCHDLVNRNGLPSEITYSEWGQSPYLAMGMECQDCHMPSYSGQAAVGGPQRNNLRRHDFVGVDMPLLSDFSTSPDVRSRIETLLRNAVTVTSEIPDAVTSGGVLRFSVTINNDKTGHDIPSSVTFVRQMWLEITAVNGADTLYRSGYFDANGDLMDSHSELNPNGDPDLALFQSALYLHGEPANVFTADSIKVGSIAPFQARTAHYSIPISAAAAGTINLRIRLRFRTFPPYAIRGVEPEMLARVPTFEMAEIERTIVIN